MDGVYPMDLRYGFFGWMFYPTAVGFRRMIAWSLCEIVHKVWPTNQPTCPIMPKKVEGLPVCNWSDATKLILVHAMQREIDSNGSLLPHVL
jgi:hypothetical protein